MDTFIPAAYVHAPKTLHLGHSVACQASRLEEAISNLELMPSIPPIEVLLSIFQKCRERKSLALAKRLREYVRSNGLQDHSIVGNHLVPLLVECGCMPDAEIVFKRLSYRNEHSWTSLILGHAQGGQLHHALNLYQKMQEEGIHPSSFTLVALIKSCASLQDIKTGREIHVEVMQKGFDADLYVGSTLVDMYVKCKLTAEAWEVFDRIAIRDVVLWTSLIAGFSEHGPAHEALKCLKQMQQEGVSPNAFTFSCTLKACGNIGSIDNGQDIHEEIVLKGFERDSFVGKSLVSMYVKYCTLLEAQQVFDNLSFQDAVSWTALLAGYTENGAVKEALKCFELMQLQGVSPDAFTFSSVLKACSSIGALEKGLEIHKEIIQEGFEKDPVIGSTLVSMYVFCDSFLEAQEVFGELSARCAVSWNALIAGFAEHGPAQEALNCIDKMQQDGIFPDAFTFAQILKVSGTLGTRDRGREVHMETVCRGYECDDFVGCSLVGMYAKWGLLEEAREVFDQLQVQDVVSWTSLITGYAEHGLAEEALKCFDHMRKLGIPVDDFTLACMLKACGSMAALDKGHQLHQEVLRKGLETDLFVGTSLLDMYAKGGSPAEARVMFDKLSFRDVVSWNALISGFGNHEGHLAIKCFENMRHEGVKPDAITFACVLTACSHGSLVQKGQELFKMMTDVYNLSPTVDHYTCMIDLLARTGHLQEALKYLESMASPPSVETWRALLNACRTYGGVHLALKCFNHLVQMNPELAASGLFMADTYEDRCFWEMVFAKEFGDVAILSLQSSSFGFARDGGDSK